MYKSWKVFWVNKKKRTKINVLFLFFEWKTFQKDASRAKGRVFWCVNTINGFDTAVYSETSSMDGERLSKQGAVWKHVFTNCILKTRFGLEEYHWMECAMSSTTTAAIEEREEWRRFPEIPDQILEQKETSWIESNQTKSTWRLELRNIRFSRRR